MRTTNCPECRWVRVVDASGRPRLEMRWVQPAAAPSAPVPGAA